MLVQYDAYALNVIFHTTNNIIYKEHQKKLENGLSIVFVQFFQ